MASTTATAVHSKHCPIRRPFTAHCLARRCCQNPTPIIAMEMSRNHGRKRSRKALAPAVPMAAAKPRGTQQAIVASELTIAAKEADRPVPDFMDSLLGLLRGGRDESFPRAERRVASLPDTIDRRLQSAAIRAHRQYHG